MLIRRALRALAVTGTAAALALSALAPANAAMTDEMAARATVAMKEMAGHIATWHAANPGQTFTNEQLMEKFPNAPKADGVIHYSLISAAPGYCFIAADSMAPLPDPNDIGAVIASLQNTRFLDSTTAQTFIPDLPLLDGTSTNKACMAALGNLIMNYNDPEKLAEGAKVTSATPFHESLIPTPEPDPEPVPDFRKVRHGLTKTARQASAKIRAAQKRKATAKPTLKQLRRAGLRPYKGSRVTVRYVKKKRLAPHCVRVTHRDARLPGRRAVWFDSGLRKVVIGAKPKGKRSACAKVF